MKENDTVKNDLTCRYERRKGKKRIYFHKKAEEKFNEVRQKKVKKRISTHPKCGERKKVKKFRG